MIKREAEHGRYGGAGGGEKAHTLRKITRKHWSIQCRASSRVFTNEYKQGEYNFSCGHCEMYRNRIRRPTFGSICANLRVSALRFGAANAILSESGEFVSICNPPVIHAVLAGRAHAAGRQRAAIRTPELRCAGCCALHRAYWPQPQGSRAAPDLRASRAPPDRALVKQAAACLRCTSPHRVGGSWDGGHARSIRPELLKARQLLHATPAIHIRGPSL